MVAGGRGFEYSSTKTVIDETSKYLEHWLEKLAVRGEIDGRNKHTRRLRYRSVLKLRARTGHRFAALNNGRCNRLFSLVSGFGTRSLRMCDADQYSLVDFGEGRKLERFGPYLIDRPCAAARDVARAATDSWLHADARFERTGKNQGIWKGKTLCPWVFEYKSLSFELKPTPFGHLGIFVEQAENWSWLQRQIRRLPVGHARVLNLFAYTGGSTLAAATAGAEVIHVDAARNVVDWARRNAHLSGLADASIRWIAEDAVKFVQRELRRGSQYNGIILDPPSYGHGRRGEVWQLKRDLLPLLKMCGELTQENRSFVLLSCHTPGYGLPEISASLSDAIFQDCGAATASRRLVLLSEDGRKLRSGVVCRWPK